MEIRTNSYLNKALILHIDRRKEFKQKLDQKNKPKKSDSKKNNLQFDERF